MSRNTSSRQPVPSTIEPAVLYHKAEFLARLRWKEHAFRTARKNGLRVLRAGGRTYCLGQDFIDYLSSLDGGQADD